jgi:hypothetical protein
MVKHFTKVGQSLATRQKSAETRQRRARIRKEIKELTDKRMGRT